MTAALRRWGSGLFRFWYHLLVGDDWTIAAGVALALAGTYAVRRLDGTAAWLLLPAACLAIVVVAIRRANRGTP